MKKSFITSGPGIYPILSDDDAEVNPNMLGLSNTWTYKVISEHCLLLPLSLFMVRVFK